MSDLHKPLRARQPKMRSLPIAKIVVAVAMVAVVAGTAAYLFFESRDEAVVVAINDNAPRTNAGAEDPGDADAANASPSSTTLRNDSIGNGLDGGVKPLSPLSPLSPLEPLEGTPAPSSPNAARTPVDTPAFIPQASNTPRPTNGRADPSLLEASEFGSLPKISDGGLRPLDAYSKAEGSVGANRVAVVIGGLGLSQTGTQAAIADLPPEITLAFSPYGNSLLRWGETARKQGHEIALQLPMEPLGYPAVDPGRETLLREVSEGENLRRLRWSLGRLQSYPVVVSYLGGNFLNNVDVLKPILEEAKKRGLGFVDDGTVAGSKAAELTVDMRMPNAKANVVLDNDRQASRIEARLREAEAIARQRGFAIATATAFPETVRAVKKWAAEAEARGIQIVPLTSLLRDYAR